MNLDQVPIGDNPPYDVNALIEIPLGGNPVKYEVDKRSGALFVDRFSYIHVLPNQLWLCPAHII